MKDIVILGAGTAGCLAANMLSNKLDAKSWRMTIIDRADKHIYQPGLLFLPFKLYGYEGEDDVVRSIEAPLPKHVNFVSADIKVIDHEKKTVQTSKGDHKYDFLISTMGCRLAPEEIEGMDLNNGTYTFYSLEHAMRLQKALTEMEGGRLVVDIADVPIKCPVAPIEFVFLADYYFELRGIRDKVDITLVTPYDGAFTKPNASRILSKTAEVKGINIVSNFALERVDSEAKVIHSYDGQSVEYDLLCAIPPNLGPQVLDDSGLGDGTGYALTDPRTLKSRKADFIYMMGDNTNVSASKAGSVAHFEAETVVGNLLREIAGEKPLPSFDGHANCFIETGHHKAMLIDFNYDMEPLTGDFPLPYVGPFSLLEESYVNHVGKIAFKWVYWNMLLKGYLPNVPLLPSHMNFLGKDLETAPQIRNATKIKVGEFMQNEVLTIRQGSPLKEAAEVMTKNKVSGLPVVDVDDRLIGIVTEADFLSSLDIHGGSAVQELFDTVIRKNRRRKKMGTIVDDIMTPDPVTVAADDTLQRALEVMDKNGIKRLIIVDEGKKVQGVISRADLIKLYTMR